MLVYFEFNFICFSTYFISLNKSYGSIESNIFKHLYDS